MHFLKNIFIEDAVDRSIEQRDFSRVSLEFFWIRITSSPKEKTREKDAKNGDRKWMVRSDRYEKR